jgi:hypothetical protein
MCKHEIQFPYLLLLVLHNSESRSYDQKKGGYMEPWKILSDWARQSYEKEGRVDHASIMMKNFL